MKNTAFISKKTFFLFLVAVSILVIGYFANKHYDKITIESRAYINLSSLAFETQMKKESVKVVLLTYGRSGSSYTGQLIASVPNSLYYFEPSLPLVRDHNLTEDRLLRVMQGLFYCDGETYNYIKKQSCITRRLGQSATVWNCERANFIIMKTIRLRLEDSIDWLSQHTDIKVIYMVRDPRGIYASTPAGWGKYKDPEYFCKTMDSDLLLYHGMPKNRTMLLKYEDVVENPVREARNVMNFLQMPWSQKIEMYIAKHQSNDMNDGDYHGLSQPKTFSPSHKWQKLPNQTIGEVEKHCKNFMRSLKYPLRVY